MPEARLSDRRAGRFVKTFGHVADVWPRRSAADGRAGACGGVQSWDRVSASDPFMASQFTKDQDARREAWMRDHGEALHQRVTELLLAELARDSVQTMLRGTDTSTAELVVASFRAKAEAQAMDELSAPKRWPGRQTP